MVGGDEEMSRLKASDFRPAREWIDRLPAASLARAKAGATGKIEAAHLAGVRKALDVTQTALAERTGLKQAEVSRIENAVETVQLRTLQRYVSGLGGRLMVVADFPDGARAEIPLRGGKPIKSRAVVRGS
jgi:hypothetical protein